MTPAVLPGWTIPCLQCPECHFSVGPSPSAGLFGVVLGLPFLELRLVLLLEFAEACQWAVLSPSLQTAGWTLCVLTAFSAPPFYLTSLDSRLFSAEALESCGKALKKSVTEWKQNVVSHVDRLTCTHTTPRTAEDCFSSTACTNLGLQGIQTWTKVFCFFREISYFLFHLLIVLQNHLIFLLEFHVKGFQCLVCFLSASAVQLGSWKVVFSPSNFFK